MLHAPSSTSPQQLQQQYNVAAATPTPTPSADGGTIFMSTTIALPPTAESQSTSTPPHSNSQQQPQQQPHHNHHPASSLTSAGDRRYKGDLQHAQKIKEKFIAPEHNSVNVTIAKLLNIYPHRLGIIQRFLLFHGVDRDTWRQSKIKFLLIFTFMWCFNTALLFGLNSLFDFICRNFSIGFAVSPVRSLILILLLYPLCDHLLLTLDT